jgi:virginiamycin B lyase
VAAGPDGALWFTEYTGDAVSRMTTSGQVTRYTLPGFASRNGGGKEPEDIAAGPDGNLWFLESSDATVGRVTPSGAISEFPIPGGGIPTRIAPGPDGQMWITSFGTGAVYRMSTSGQVTATYNLPTEFSGPRGIVAGADGAIWVVEGPRGKLARITTDGQITELEGGAGEMASIVVGPDHALYATGPDGGGVDAINRTDGGPIERATAPAGTVDAVLGSDGALWMTESGADKLLRVLPSTPAPPPPTRCVVPKVLGLKLAAAKTRLVKAHCRLGKVKRPRRAAAGRLRVTRQSPRAGTTKPAGTKVALTLGLRR